MSLQDDYVNQGGLPISEPDYPVLTAMKVPANYRAAGYIYVLGNESMPGIYKIGMTKHEPELRAKEISSTTGVPTPFSVIAAFHSRNPRADERMVHEAFDDCRVNQNREFFSLAGENDLRDALDELQSVVGPERNADVADLAVTDTFISFSNENEIDLVEELYDQGIGGVVGNLSAVKNFLIRAGINHVKDIINQHHASIVIGTNGAISLVKSYETQWLEAQNEQQCSST
ncbi:GIY-YIG nuclease family protein [Pectobacterium carotovorum]|uniref:GIY-YIG nuclease family protein n=1 Tax=Pectobacterium carotovorum TaxID=554 RepID=UPI0030181A03